MVQLKRVIFSCFILSSMFGLFLLLKPDHPAPQPSQELPSFQSIIAKSNLTIQPVINPTQLHFNFLIESYEHPDMLNLDMRDFSVLQCQQAPLEANDWIMIETLPHHINAQLVFNLTDQPCPFPIRLELFFDRPIAITWQNNVVAPFIEYN